MLFLIVLCVVVLTHCTIVSTSIRHDVVVTAVDDLANSHCTTMQSSISSSNNCTLRAAWSVCQSLLLSDSSTDAECRITLPEGQTISHDLFRGPLVHHSPGVVTISGHKSTVLGIAQGQRSWRQSASSSLPILTNLVSPADSMASTTFNFTVCEGTTVLLSTCHPQSSGDTVLSVMNAAGQKIIENDDLCGSLSRLTVSLPATGDGYCEVYTTELSCYAGSECQVYLTADRWPTAQYSSSLASFVPYTAALTSATEESSLSAHSPDLLTQFVVVLSPNTSALSLRDLTLSSFGSIRVIGGAIAVIGSAGSYHQTFSLSLANVTVRDCFARHGGAIAVLLFDDASPSAVEIVLSDVSLINNTAALFGGAVYARDFRTAGSAVSLIVSGVNTSISHCNADYGAGIAVASRGGMHSFVLTLQGLTFSDMFAAVNGGSVYGINLVDASLYFLSLYRSRAMAYGGGIWLRGATNAQLKGLRVTRGWATFGGSVYSLLGNGLQISDAYILRGRGDWYGGGFYLIATSSVQIFDVKVANSFSLYYGGGIYMQSSSDIAIHNASFIDVWSTYAGVLGGFSVDSVQITSVSMENCHARFAGGMLFFQSINLRVSDHTVSDMTALEMGGSYIFDSCDDAHLDNVYVSHSSVLTNNRDGVGGGGAIYSIHCNSLSVTNVIVESASARIGGAVDLYYCDHCLVQNMSVSDSSALYGGALLLQNSSWLTVTDISVRSGSSEHFGGGVYAYSCDHMDFQRVNIDSSHAATSGGAINLESSDYVTLAKIVITNSSAGSCGAIVIDSCTGVDMHDVSISGAHATGARGVGGGMCLNKCGSFSLHNLFVDNSSAPSHGGGVYVTGSKELDIVNATVQRCRSEQGNGGGFFIDKRNDYLSFAEVNVIENVAGAEGGGVFMSSLNNYVHWLGRQSYWNQRVFSASNATKSRSFDFPGASEIILYFDEEETQFSSMYQFCCTDLVVTDQTGTELFVASEKTDYLPGKDQAAMVLSNVTHIKATYTNAYNLAENAVRMVMIPVYSHTAGSSGDCVTRGNIAAEDGGGLLMSYSNPGFVMLHHCVQDNIAQSGSGGGMLLRSTNSRGLVSHSLFEGNVAGMNGGGVSLGFSHYSLHLQSIILRDNLATTGKGGGLFAFSNNGYGALDYGNQVNCTRCIIENNRAGTSGGGVHLEQQNAMVFERTRFQANSVSSSYNPSASSTSVDTSEYGGALSVSLKNEVIIRTAEMFNNRAESGCGGGLAVTDVSNIVSVYDVRITTSKALNGGAVCILADSSLNVQSRFVVTGNQAVDAGGGVLISHAPLWVALNGIADQVTIAGNMAARGSAVFLHGLVSYSATASIGYVTLAKNRALKGSTINWIYDPLYMVSPPVQFSRSSNVSILVDDGSGRILTDFNDSYAVHWVNNFDTFGRPLGTQPVLLQVPRGIIVDDYQHSLKAITIYARDFYGQIIGDSNVKVDIDRHRCLEVERPYLSGSNILGVGVDMIQGHAVFQDLRVHCFPTGDIVLKFSVVFSPLQGIADSETDNSNFTLVAHTALRFRPCQEGEYITGGACTLCPNGTYNLRTERYDNFSDDALTAPPSMEYNGGTLTCKSCSNVAGVRTCYGNVIELLEGYWRRHPQSQKVLSCFYGSNSCLGGTSTGDKVCAKGYTGPLCGGCDDGYYKANSVCLRCSDDSVNPTQIATIAVAGYCLLFVVVMWFRHRVHQARLQASLTGAPVQVSWLSFSLEEFNDWMHELLGSMMVKIKIIVATIQVVISSAEVFDVAMPGSYTSFSQALGFTNLNLASIVPLTCLHKVSYPTRVAWATIAPFAILLAILLIMVFEYLVETCLFACNARTATQRANLRERLRYRYINYVFYITYLVLPSVTTMIFKLFICENVDPDGEDGNPFDSYLVADVSVACHSEYYKRWLIYGYAMILVYPVGIPLFYFICLYRFRDDIVNRNDPIHDMREADQHAQQADTGTPITIAQSATPTPLENSRSGRADVKRMVSFKDSNDEGLSEKASSYEDEDVDESSGERALGKTTTVNDVQRTLTVDVSSPPRRFSAVKTDDLQTKELMSPTVSPTSVEPSFAPSTHPNKRHHPRPLTRKQLQERMSATAMNMSFLWEAYKPEYWYWELVETSRRVLLTSVLSVCATGSPKQAVLGILIAYTSNKIYNYFQPYAVFSDYRMADVGQIQIFLTYFATLVLSASLVNESWMVWVVGVLLIAVNLVIFVLGLYYELRRIWRENESVRRQVKRRIAHAKESLDRLVNREDTDITEGWSGFFKFSLSRSNSQGADRLRTIELAYHDDGNSFHGSGSNGEHSNDDDENVNPRLLEQGMRAISHMGDAVIFSSSRDEGHFLDNFVGSEEEKPN